ncbi:MAG TPA: aminoacetone oxidase family FAD-binding enzyme [Opitutae bacterium]|nr:aminoacetone oxidase family FAD-binding enzyme [Puniceicoccaceae bacterium]HBR95410.1 aminoacetone oxidase family FAD-binding enzyme [Opitutae bacterium]|tara:strand:+ start:8268 stop:9485 length:1218 start_codon:yes stop_codon:yes gene_type:complete
MDNSRREIAIIGGGPAGLRAAEVAACRGAAVTVFDAKPSVGRKFLVAGRSGLNLTNSADFETFLAQYSGRDFPVERWREYLKDFDNYHLSDWAAELGVDTFAASSGKVFPFSKKAAPLLRRWVLRLRELGVVFRMKHQWTGLAKQPDGRIQIDCLQGDQPVQARFDAVVLAMGGASWPQTGSTGSWVSILEAQGVEVLPFAAANCGWECDWSPETRAQIEGKPLQNLKLSANGRTLTGELVATRYGFEGTPLYTLGRELRRMASPVIEIDFKPTFTEARLIAKMESARRNFYKEAGLRWKLNETACAILRQYYGEFHDAASLAQAAKCCRIPLTQARPIAEAISTAGGVAWSELDAQLMLKQLPGVYCAGEMIDWEAPTGGFLIQGCFVTGNVAGQSAAAGAVMA